MGNEVQVRMYRERRRRRNRGKEKVGGSVPDDPTSHQAVTQAQLYLAEGYGWVIDLDLEKFFDRVNHDKLMGQVAKHVEERLLKLIRAFLNGGAMENGLVSPSVEGTPQGGPLSPLLLSNLVLNELDRELERRGHRYVRYADDCNIYEASEPVNE